MGSDPQSYLHAMHEMEHKACNERIAVLEAQLAVKEHAIAGLNGLCEKAERELASTKVSLAETTQSHHQLAKELREERARLRNAIMQTHGGMHPGSAIWGHTQYDKGYAAGITAALTAFDAAIDAARETKPE